MRPDDRAARLGPLLLVAAIALVWAPSLDAPFTYDDKIEVVGNPTIRVLTEWSAVATYNLSRPLLILTYALNWACGALDPVGYHVVSVALHAANAVLAARLLRRWLDPGRALLGAAAWALHPMVTEGVTYITGRSDALCATAWLVALTAWTDHLRGRPGASRVAWVAVVAGLLTKEVAVALPLAMLVLDVLVERRGAPVGGRLRAYLPALVLLAAAGTVRLAAYGWPRAEAERGALTQVLAQAEAWAVYTRLWLVPVGQSILHDLPAEVRWQGFVALVAGVGGIGLAVVRSPRVGGALLLAACWLLPSSLVPLKEVLAEHRAYLAGLVPAALFAAVVPAPRAALLVVAALAAATVARNDVWSSEPRLWADAAARNPGSADAAYGHAEALRYGGDPAAAEAEYRRCLTLRPDDEDARIGLGIALADQGRLAEAREVWQDALRLNRASCPAHNNLGALEMRESRLRAAIVEYDSTLRWCPGDPLALIGLARAHEALGEPEAARTWYGRYLDAAPWGAFRDEARDGVERNRW